MDKDMGDPGGVTTVSSSELRSELRALILDTVVRAYETGWSHAKARSRLIVHSDGCEDTAVWVRRAAEEIIFPADGPQGQDAADQQPRDEQQPRQETDHDR